MKTCKVCKIEFHPQKMGQKVCGPECAISLAVSERCKAEKVAQVKDRRETKAKLTKLKSKAQWAREAQSAFNSYIRARDAKEPCISCGRHHGGQYHAGHYLSVGARPELRFEESNVHRQCAPCNTHLSGNVVSYRIALVRKLGLQAVDWLEGHHEPRRDTVETLAALKAHYAAKARELAV